MIISKNKVFYLTKLLTLISNHLFNARMLESPNQDILANLMIKYTNTSQTQ